LVAEGDYLATLVRGTGTQSGEFMGIPPTGKHASWYAYGINRFEDGKMREHWGLPDLQGMMRQLGVGPGGPEQHG
jgi:predicted ester cyclase